MSLGNYLQERIKVIILNFIALITLSTFLFSVGNTFDTIITVVAAWFSYIRSF